MMFKETTAVLFSLVLVVSTIGSDEWAKFKKQYNKNYSQSEERYRKAVWEENVRKIETHNSEAARGKYSYTLGFNSFTDITHEEFRSRMRGLKTSVQNTKSQGQPFIPKVDLKNLPDTMNWTAKGYVTEVGNQFQCGSCWAFSVLGALEGQWKAVHNKLVRLSEQDLMDCSHSAGNQGCEGGFMDKTYEFIKKRGGVDTWESYPYTGKNGKCHYNTSTIGATCSGYVDIQKGSEMDLLLAVGSIGPVAVAVDATHASFEMYKDGVLDEPKCSSTNVDHTLLVTGYGTYKGKDYWLAKNSWGTSWGMNGYIMMSRNKDNQCGIATLASYPTVK